MLKAIEKDPKARYRSAEAMGEDLRRFLADEPIRARQVSAPERYWRWARRNQAIAVLGGSADGGAGRRPRRSRCWRWSGSAPRPEPSARLPAERGARPAGKADQANASLRATQEELHRTVYATRSNLALAAWDAADVGRLRSLLDLLRPAPGEPDLRGWEWRYLWQLGHEDRLTLRAQADSFADVAFSPDGKTLAGLEGRGRIQLWDRHTGESRLTTGVTTQGRHADLASGVSALAFSPDGRSLAGPGPDESLMLYAVDTGLPTLSFEGSPGAVQELAFSPDGRTLVAAISAHSMRVWDARDGHLIHRIFGGHRRPGRRRRVQPRRPHDRLGQLRPHGQALEIRRPEQAARDPRAGTPTRSAPWPSAPTAGGSPRPGSTGRSGSGMPGPGRRLAVIRGHTGAVSSLAYGPDGCESRHGLRRRDGARLGHRLGPRSFARSRGTPTMSRAVAVSPDGRDFASASGDRTVRGLGRRQPAPPRTLQSPLGADLRRGRGMPGVQPRRPPAGLGPRRQRAAGLGTPLGTDRST